MRGVVVKAVCVVAGTLLIPGAVLAQGSLTGVVKDTSGAVLPGVTVEAASPVLIEKVRTAVSDSDGQYRIIDLRGGVYTVTFTLGGFATVKRDGVRLSGEAIVPVNAELRVGALEETITVQAQTLTVDTTSTTRQQVMSREVINTLPTGRTYSSFAGLLTGVTMDRPDPGGAAGDPMATLSIHGSRPGDTRILQNGVNTMTLQAGGDLGIAVPNPGMASEVTIDTSGVSAELSTGGARINYIPRDGGNTFTGSTFLTFANTSMQADNLTDELKAKGLSSANTIKKIYDINPGFGGPIRKDRMWFFFTGRVNRADGYVANAFYNKNAFDPSKWTYEADPSRPGSNDSYWQDAQLRVTTQVTPRNKVAFTWDQQTRCSCPGYQNLDLPFGISSTTSPEASSNFRSPTQRLLHAEWSSPITSKLLVEAVGLHRSERWGFMHPTHSAAPNSITAAEQAILESGALIPVLNTATGQFYRGMFVFYNNNWVPNYYFRGTMTYVTKGHQIKAGITDVTGFLDMSTYNFSPVSYITIPGAPISIIRQTTWSSQAIHAKNDQHYDLGLFVQDRWTMDKLTINYGVRFDGYNSGSPEQHVIGKTPLTPNRADIDFAPTDFNNWKDITPRFGLAYDVAGDGKTAVKVSLNKYLASQTAGGSQGGIAGTPGINPVSRLVNVATRVWINGGDFTKAPKCDLTNPNANGDCLALDNPNFGLNDPNVGQYSEDSQFGWGKRQYNWEFAAGVQRELLPRLSVDVGYFRRWFGNFLVTDNLALSADEYAKFDITAPTATGFPGGGETIAGLVDPVRIVGTRNLTTRASDYGTQIEHWNGVDVTVNARFENGLFLFGGVNTGRTSLDNCEILAKVPEAALVTPLGAATPVLTPLSFCHVDSPFLTQLKMNGAYTIPKADVLLSATLQSMPGPEVFARYNNSVGANGQPLSNGSQNTNIIAPRSLFGERLNQVDLRIGKIVRLAKTRTSLNLDIFNVFNRSTVTRENPAFGAFRQPVGIALARFVKVGAQFDF